MFSSTEAEMSAHPLPGPIRVAHAVHGPSQRLPEGLTQDRPTGLADGHQRPVRPLIRMALPQLPHQEAVRQHDEVHMPGLALAVTQLTVPHAQLLLALAMERLRACPAVPIAAHRSINLPLHAIAHQDDARRRVLRPVPDDYDADLMAHVRQAQRAREVPLPA